MPIIAMMELLGDKCPPKISLTIFAWKKANIMAKLLLNAAHTPKRNIFQL